MRKQNILISIIILLLTVHTAHTNTDNRINPIIKLNLQKKGYNKMSNRLNFTKKDTIPSIFMGTLNLAKDFIPLLFVDKNIGVTLFEFSAPYDGNIILIGYVSAGTNSQMLYSRLIKNGEIISQKSCGIGSPLRNGPFNYQTLVKTGDRLSIQIIVIDTNWQLHCCPDLYNCNYIFIRNGQ
jgi:hypothetical protein